MRGFLDRLTGLFWAAVALLVMVCVTLALMAEITTAFGFLVVLFVLSIVARIVWARTRGW